MEHKTDNSLMLKVQAGDIEKMGMLFDRYNKPLFGYLYHQTGQRIESEDLVQTVFYRMLKYKHTFTADGEFRAWMYQMARNALIDTAKKTNRIQYKEDLVSLSEFTLKDDSLEEQMYENEQKTMIQTALNQLPDDQRELLILSKFQELPYKEIAAILDTTEGNVKVKIHRAIKDLRTIYIKTNGRV